MNLNILVLPGDGIGAEVTGEAVRVLRVVAANWNHQLTLSEGLLGGIAIHKTGTPFPAGDRRAGAEGRCDADGRGGPAGVRQCAAGEAARSAACSAFARRWASTPICGRCARYKALLDSSPLKNDLVDGVDMIIVRELTGGLYYGTPRGISRQRRGRARASTPWPTRGREIERVSRMAFRTGAQAAQEGDLRR